MLTFYTQTQAKGHTNTYLVKGMTTVAYLRDNSKEGTRKKFSNFPTNIHISKLTKGLFISLLLFVVSGSVSGQAVGDYGTSVTNGTSTNWSTASSWVVCATAGSWNGATAAPAAPTNLKKCMDQIRQKLSCQCNCCFFKLKHSGWRLTECWRIQFNGLRNYYVGWRHQWDAQYHICYRDKDVYGSCNDCFRCNLDKHLCQFTGNIQRGYNQ